MSRVSDHDVVRVYPTPTPSAVAAAPGDMAIAGSVGQLLVNRANQIPPNNIRAAVKDGVVTLQGTAPSAELRRDLEDAISQMSGVKRVENKLQLELR